ncbi:MAG: tryptophan synthase subunit beta [Coxiellaceae bacterium]|nr:MAG: tryptophan synthase subunit beta [Coxiellaceae bacterium]
MKPSLTNITLTLPEKPVLPDKNGFYGNYGGQFVPEILRPNLEELEKVFYDVIQDSHFWQLFMRELAEFSGRPTPITFAKNLTEVLGGAKIYIKREDLGQTGAHKINNVIGQGLLVKRLGKPRVIAETGAGQHGVATATMAARFKLDACIYMGSEDVYRQRPNVFWMERMGAKVVPVTQGACTLKDAINEALRDWSGNLETTHYVLGTVCGPHPFPALVSYFQSVIGLEARQQMLQYYDCMPDKVYACIGGGSNALGIFQGFLTDNVELVGVEAGGVGDEPGQHAARLASKQGTVGIAQGFKTQFLQSTDGQLLDTHSVAAGLDFVGISPILADWAERGKIRVAAAGDAEVLAAIELCMRTEGIIPALESAHALACAFSEVQQLAPTQSVLINLSGRGDKDIFTMARAFKDQSWADYLRTQLKSY